MINLRKMLEDIEAGRVLLTADMATAIQCAKNWEKLIELIGHLADGSQTVVTLAQDDATRTQHISVGKVSYWGNGWQDVLDKIKIPEAFEDRDIVLMKRISWLIDTLDDGESPVYRKIQEALDDVWSGRMVLPETRVKGR
jgi:hypothetical protein